MHFETEIEVGFEHADVAGVVFYARYFEMLSRVVQRWFEQRLDTSYHRFHQVEKRGIPLVDVHCRFTAPSFLSDVLTFRLEVTRLGRRSMTLHITASCNGQARMDAKMVVVHAQLTDTGMTGLDFPPELAQRIRPFVRVDNQS